MDEVQAHTTKSVSSLGMEPCEDLHHALRHARRKMLGYISTLFTSSNSASRRPIHHVTLRDLYLRHASQEMPLYRISNHNLLDTVKDGTYGLEQIPDWHNGGA